MPGMRILAAVLLLLPVACGGAAPEVPKRINIAVTGTPQCLADAMHALGDNVGLARMPDWKGGIGTMEFGPFQERDYIELASRLRQRSCIHRFEQRPCRIEGTDRGVPGCEMG